MADGSPPLPPIEWRGAASRPIQVALLLVAWYAMLAIAAIAMVEKAEKADGVVAWVEIIAVSLLLAMGAALPITVGGLSPFRGMRASTRLDAHGVAFDRRALGQGVLRVPWTDVEAIHRKGVAVGLRLRCYDGLLTESDGAALDAIARGIVFGRAVAFLRYFSGIAEAVEAVLRRPGPPAAVLTEHLERRPDTVEFLRIARNLGGYELDFPFGERDIGTTAFVARVQRYLDAADQAGSGPPSAAGGSVRAAVPGGDS